MQAQLQQQLQHASDTEQLLAKELAGAKQQLQQALHDLQNAIGDAAEAAAAAAVRHDAEMQQLRQQLGGEAAAEVGQRMPGLLAAARTDCRQVLTPVRVVQQLV